MERNYSSIRTKKDRIIGCYDYRTEIVKAIITAGGRGSRLYPITNAIPKELISFCGIPTIEYGIRYLKENGITDIIIVVGPKKNPIVDYLGNGELFGVHISFVVQEQPLGLGHSVLTVENFLGIDEDGDDDGDDFILLLGDTIFIGKNDLQEMIKTHKNNKASTTIMLEHITQNPERYGIAKFDDKSDGRLFLFSVVEKPAIKYIQEEYKSNYEGVIGWYSIAGLYILNSKIFGYLKKTTRGINNEVQLTDAIELSLNVGDIILGYILKGKRIDIGSWDYINDERDFYLGMTNEDIEKIVVSREEMKKR